MVSTHTQSTSSQGSVDKEKKQTKVYEETRNDQKKTAAQEMLELWIKLSKSVESK